MDDEPTPETEEPRTEERASCTRCGGRYAPEAAAAGLCGGCRLEEFPPISDRGSRWSPLALGGISLLCDPLLIPTILAIKRGLEELGKVRRREMRGYWSPEHESVRTGAVWGIFLAAARPLAFAFALCVGVLSAVFAHDEPEGVVGPSEVEEILERVADRDDEARALAREHLGAVGSYLTRQEVEQVLRVAEGTDGSGPDARETRTALVKAALAAGPVGGPSGPVVTLERLRRLYPELSVSGRKDVLLWVSDRGTGAAAEVFVELVRQEAVAPVDAPALEVPALPYGALRRQTGLAERVWPELLGFRATHPYHRGGVRLAAALCRDENDPRMGSSSRDALLSDWATSRRLLEGHPEVGSPWERLEPVRTFHARAGADALTALSCASGDDVDEALREASGHDDPRVAVAGVDGLLRRRRPVSDRRIRELSRDPLSRSALVEVLITHGGLTRMPLAQRRIGPLSESDLVPWLEERELVPTEVERLATEGTAFVDHYAVYRVRTENGEEHVALGPYPPSAWASDGRGADATRWRPEDGEWTESSIRALVARARSEHDADLVVGGRP